MRQSCVQNALPLRPVARADRAGYTLMEVIVSVAIMSILLAAVGSTIVLAGKAVPDAGNPADRSISAAITTEQMTTELYSALSVTQKSATMIEFTVHRGGSNQTIRYEWSGTAGDPLTRRYNGGTIVNILQDVQDFTLTYHTTESNALESVGIELLTGSSPTIRVRAEALTLNRPEVPS